ncbi:MAG: HEAT repeat domain-containing protein [Pseudomonadota bacterium]
MHVFHPEQYFPVAFFVIILVNLLSVFALVIGKSWRSVHIQRSNHRIAKVVDRIIANYRVSGSKDDPSIARQLSKLNPGELRKAAERLNGISSFGLCDLLCRVLVRNGRIDPVLRSASDGPRWNRIDALITLGYLRHAPAMRLLRRALLDPDSDVVFAAVSALSTWNTKGSVETLILLLSKGSPVNPSRLAAAIEVSSADVSDALRRKALSADPVSQYWAATLLGRYPSAASRAALKTLLASPNPNVRAAALTSLGKIGDGIDNGSLVSALSDPEWFVRAQAARACGEQRVVAALPKLSVLLRDSEWWVRADAREAIEALGPPSIDHLLRTLADNDRFARNMAAQALDNMGYVDSAIWDLHKEDEHRERAIEALSAIRKAEGAPELAEKISRLDPVLFDRLKNRLQLEGAA